MKIGDRIKCIRECRFDALYGTAYPVGSQGTITRQDEDGNFWAKMDKPCASNGNTDELCIYDGAGTHHDAGEYEVVSN